MNALLVIGTAVTFVAITLTALFGLAFLIILFGGEE